jgi:hypothetical protein
MYEYKFINNFIKLLILILILINFNKDIKILFKKFYVIFIYIVLFIL